jgi:hypothetical protein
MLFDVYFVNIYLFIVSTILKHFQQTCRKKSELGFTLNIENDLCFVSFASLKSNKKGPDREK